MKIQVSEGEGILLRLAFNVTLATWWGFKIWNQEWFGALMMPIAIFVFFIEGVSFAKWASKQTTQEQH